MCYLDNEAARITVLKLSSDSEALTLLSNSCALLEEERPVLLGLLRPLVQEQIGRQVGSRRIWQTCQLPGRCHAQD